MEPSTEVFVEETMDEVKAMARAGEAVGKAVGTGMHAVRLGAQRAGHAGAEMTVRAAHVAEQKLAERGVAPRQLTDALVQGAEVAREEAAKTTRRTRRKLERTAKNTRKELAKAAKQAHKQAAKSAPAKTAKSSTKQVKQAKQEAKEQAKELRAQLKADVEELRGRVRDGARSMAAAKADVKVRAKAAKQAAKEAGETKRRRRRWPLMIGVAAIGAGVAYALRSRPEPEIIPEPRHRADDSEPSEPAAKKSGEASGDRQHNGQRKPSSSATKRSN